MLLRHVDASSPDSLRHYNLPQLHGYILDAVPYPTLQFCLLRELYINLLPTQISHSYPDSCPIQPCQLLDAGVDKVRDSRDRFGWWPFYVRAEDGVEVEVDILGGGRNYMPCPINAAGRTVTELSENERQEYAVL